MEGILLETHEQVQTLIEKTYTKTGLKVTASIIKKAYNIGRVITKKMLESIPVVYDMEIPGLNYSLCPQK